MRFFLALLLVAAGACGGEETADRSLAGLVAGELTCAVYRPASGTVDGGMADAALDAAAADAAVVDAAADAAILDAASMPDAGAATGPATARCWGPGGTPGPSPFGSFDGALILGDPNCVLNDGRLRCVGRNDHGQLGDGSTSDTPSEILTSVGLRSVVAAATARHGFGGGFACAITRRDGPSRVSCWGAGDRGQLGQGTEDDPSPRVVPELTGARTIALGSAHGCAIVEDEAGPTVRCWGAGDRGQLGNGSTADRSPTPVEPPVGDNALDLPAQLTAGARHSCALDAADGEIWCWGANDEGQLGDGTTTDRSRPVRVDTGALAEELGETPAAVSVSAGAFHTCALFAGGEVACWGSGDHGQVGRAGQARVPRRVPLEQPAEVVAAGPFHTCALAGQAVYCWGLGPQLGRGTTTDTSRPQRVAL